MDDTKEFKVNITLNVVCDCEKESSKREEEVGVWKSIRDHKIDPVLYQKIKEDPHYQEFKRGQEEEFEAIKANEKHNTVNEVEKRTNSLMQKVRENTRYQDFSKEQTENFEFRQKADTAEKEYGMLWPVYKYFWKP